MLRARAGSVATDPVPIGVRPLKLASVGDINLGDAPGAAIDAHGPRYPWVGSGRALRSADVAFGNLECAVSTRGEPVPKQYNFRGTPAALAGLRRASGIDVLNLANNHVGDYGPPGHRRHGARRRATRHEGGRRRSRPETCARAAGRGAARACASRSSASGDRADGVRRENPGRPGTAWANPESIAAAVQAARRNADVVVASFHWGIERQTLETARQRELADAAVPGLAPRWSRFRRAPPHAPAGAAPGRGDRRLLTRQLRLRGPLARDQHHRHPRARPHGRRSHRRELATSDHLGRPAAARARPRAQAAPQERRAHGGRRQSLSPPVRGCT